MKHIIERAAFLALVAVGLLLFSQQPPGTAAGAGAPPTPTPGLATAREGSATSLLVEFRTRTDTLVSAPIDFRWRIDDAATGAQIFDWSGTVTAMTNPAVITFVPAVHSATQNNASPQGYERQLVNVEWTDVSGVNKDWPELLVKINPHR